MAIIKSATVVALALLFVAHLASANVRTASVSSAIAQDCEGGKCKDTVLTTTLKKGRALLKVPNAPVCPTGQYLQLLTGTCKKCSAGRAKSTTGAGTCVPCRSGTIAATAGTSKCTACPAGSTSLGPLPKECVPCKPGTFAPEIGSVRCIPCFENSISDYGASECDRCPRGTGTRGKSGQAVCYPL